MIKLIFYYLKLILMCMLMHLKVSFNINSFWILTHVLNATAMHHSVNRYEEIYRTKLNFTENQRWIIVIKTKISKHIKQLYVSLLFKGVHYKRSIQNQFKFKFSYLDKQNLSIHVSDT